MKIVLDTNSFISCIGKLSPYRNVFNAFLNREYTLCVSTEIFLEYEEKFGLFWGAEVTHNLLGTILTAENTSLYDIFYFFHLVQGDVDDNKFADTYLSSNADLLISNDRKLLALNQNEFPPMRVMSLEDFSKQLSPRG
ncbi:MAG: PilT protein domain protein [Bacteroidota bacterium]|nr:PilT protein domain protein [Bacteroidota bacterium]